MAAELTVVHDPENDRYVLLRDGIEIGQTVYDHPEPGLIEFLHTEIDSSLQEHGLGSALAAGALDDVRAHSTDRVAAICPFVSGFIRKHPEYADLRTR
ncbi:MAG TPA: GNAT family N-acetyltransferase [Pseudolysinimonas sp.]|nr:GNAT family N-acetyltransferase [Pseudolysinimonas sp.]